MKIVNKNFIHESNWSISYKVDNHFIKFLKYPRKSKLYREVMYSKIAYENEIATASPIAYGYSIKEKSFFIKYNFIELKKINISLLKNNKTFFNDFENILNQFNHIDITNIKDLYWKQKFFKEFKVALYNVESYLYDKYRFSYNANSSYKYLKALKLNSFVHGDLSFSNIYLVNKEIFIVDFEHGSIGPRDWDLCYFIATSPELINILGFTRNIDMKLVKIISAIRLGRAIIKGKNIENRLKTFYLLSEIE